MFTREDALKSAKKIDLSREEQNYLLSVIKKGENDYSKRVEKETISAREKLRIEFNPLILSIVEKYAKSGEPLVELVSLGEKGLKNAIRLWDVNKKRKYKFVYYAAWFIRAEIHKKLRLPTDPEGFGELRK